MSTPIESLVNQGIGGSDALNLPPLTTVHYWRGIKEALEQAGCHRVIITRVPRTASIEDRAETLREEIADKCKPGEELNLLGHSMVISFLIKVKVGRIRCQVHDFHASSNRIQHKESDDNCNTPSVIP